MVKMKTNAALMTKDIMQGCYRSLISKHCDFSFVHFQIADNKRTTLIKSYSQGILICVFKDFRFANQ